MILPLNIKNILVIRLSSLGDVILTTPLLRFLKKQNPEILIDYIIKEEFLDAIKFNRNVNEFIIFKKDDTKELKKKIKTKNYDFIIDLQNNFRSRKLYNKFNHNVVKFKKNSLNKFLLTNFKINRFKEIIPISQRYINTITSERLSEEDLIPEIYYPDSIDKQADKLFNLNSDQKIIGICPGSKHFTKTYPKEKFRELIEELTKTYKVFLFGGSNEKELTRYLTINEQVFNFQNENDLFLTTALMKKCDMVVTNDSALMHIANALKKPIIAIFGSSVREWGFAPVGVASKIIEVENLSCRPCSHFGKSYCPEKHFKCMLDISSKEIISEINKLLTL